MKRSSFEPVFLRPLAASPPRRPAPARPVRNPARARRIAVAVLVIALAAILVARGSKAALDPLMALHRSGREIRSLESTLAQEQLRKQRLQQQMAYLSTAAGVEEEARRQGWVRQGETAIQVVRSDSEPAAQAGPPPASTPAHPSLLRRLQSFAETCLAPFGRKEAPSAARPGPQPAN